MKQKEKQINLETERLLLRKLTIDDAKEAFNNWCNDDNISRYMRWSTHKTIEDTKKWLEEEIKNYNNIKNLPWGIELKETGELIGTISVFLSPEDDNRYEIGYDIAKKYWNKGYVTEAAKCVIDYLVNDLGIDKFVGKHAKLNFASGEVLQKLGFRYIRDDFYESFDNTKLFESKVYYLDIYENIFKASLEDVKGIADIIKRGWNTAYKGLIDEDFLKNMDVNKMYKHWKESIQINDNVYVYYKENESILGVIRFGINEQNLGEVYALYIKPEEKRKGIGTKLLNFAKQELLKSKCKELIIWCLKGNIQGINFYKKMGGSNMGERNYEVNGLNVDEIGFKYKLDGNSIEDEIILVKPTKEYKKQAIEYKQEYFDNGEFKIHACAKWDKIDNYDEWLEMLLKNSKKETVSKDWTVTSTFFGIRKSDNKIIGMIDIRHDLKTDFLRNYAGHIGYSVLPSERRKGYATQMLNKGLYYCRQDLKLDKVMVNCHKENEGSRKTIVNAGGVLEREYLDDEGKVVQLYWINLK